jgi:hypothetical protein
MCKSVCPICTFSHLHILTSSNSHILTSSHLHILTLVNYLLAMPSSIVAGKLYYEHAAGQANQ